MKGKLAGAALGMLLAGAWSGTAWGQGEPPLAGLNGDELRTALQQRYEAALAETRDPAIVNADDPRYIWATQAKVQCGIAIGFMQSSTRDPVSIGKCAMASDYMRRAPAPRVVYIPPPPPPAPRPACNANPALVFFEFDSAEVPADARQTLQYVTQNAAPCGWHNFNVVGHADRSGSDAYNMRLSRRRADAVASLMASMGVAPGAIATDAKGESEPRVPTADGVREPQNRRVEVTPRP